MQARWLVLFGVTLACTATPQPVATQPVALPTASASTAPVTKAPDDSGLTPKGPIPLADGRIAMQVDERYGALAYGHADLGPYGLVVHLTDAPMPCGTSPRPPHLSVNFQVSEGPDGTFYADKVVTTNIEYTRRGFGHVKLDSFELAEGKHITGQLAYSDPGSGAHNGAVIKPSHAAGSFDVVLCSVAEADKAKLHLPHALTGTSPLAFGMGRVSSAPKTVLVSIEYDGADREPWVSRVEAFEQAGVTCDSPFVTHGLDMKLYFGVVASDLPRAQPTRFEPDAPGSQTMRESRVAWVKLEPFDLASAATAKGTVAAYAPAYDTDPGATTPVHLPPASLTGTFEATICRYGSKFGKPYL